MLTRFCSTKRNIRKGCDPWRHQVNLEDLLSNTLSATKPSVVRCCIALWSSRNYAFGRTSSTTKTLSFSSVLQLNTKGSTVRNRVAGYAGMQTQNLEISSKFKEPCCGPASISWRHILIFMLRLPSRLTGEFTRSNAPYFVN